MNESKTLVQSLVVKLPPPRLHFLFSMVSSVARKVKVFGTCTE